MKVLIYCPLNPKTPRVFARTITSIFNLDWPHPMEIVFGKDDEPVSKPYNNLTEKYNRARQMTLDGGYDALLTIEADMIVPPDTVKRLAAVDADVAYGLYVSRHGRLIWLAFTAVSEHAGTSISVVPEQARASWGKVIETKGVGMGCTFIHRHVLEAIEFRHPPTTFANDWYFSLDCMEHGFVQKHDMGCVCGHIQGAPAENLLA